MTAEKIDITPLYRIVPRRKLRFRWPSSQDVTAIGALAMSRSANGEVARAAMTASVIEVLADVPEAKALKIANDFPDEIEAVIRHLFKKMRASLNPLDARLSERFPQILAGEVI